MKHYIVTRFNVKIEDFQKDKNGKSIKDAEYLSRRFYLFEKYCFPSIEKQTNRNFRWLVYFDVDTPESFKQRNNTLCLRLPIYEPIYVRDYSDFLFHYQSKCSDTEETVIFTRLDNDDVLMPEYVSSIQDYILQYNVQNGIVDYPIGLLYDLQTKIMVQCEIRSYHFLSVVDTDRKQSKKLYQVHSKLKETKPYYLIVADAPLWIEFCHESNILNDINRTNGKVLFKDRYSGMQLPISFILSSLHLLRLFCFTIFDMIKYKILRPAAVSIGIRHSSKMDK
ncbi:MAG: hypothetical protein IKO46_06460 [Salinivirgaceae bacterium]|nr:hypothetical protein [Salinivirgaceae bacterium]